MHAGQLGSVEYQKCMGVIGDRFREVREVYGHSMGSYIRVTGSVLAPYGFIVGRIYYICTIIHQPDKSIYLMPLYEVKMHDADSIHQINK